MSEVEFIMPKKLSEDSFEIGNFLLCNIRVMNISDFPWFLLVPKVPDVCEIYDLSEENQQQLILEIAKFSKIINRIYAPEKINVAMLGNQVPTLHVHVIARFKDDKAWPNPVFSYDKTNYSLMKLQEVREVVQNFLKKEEGFVASGDNIPFTTQELVGFAL